jgi:hypothetical protein
MPEGIPKSAVTMNSYIGEGEHAEKVYKFGKDGL